jgi:hypothetical protein
VTDHEQELRDFLGPGDRSVDYDFTESVRRRVLAEEAVKTARRTAWGKFGHDALGSGAIVLLMMLLGARPGLFSPANGAAAFSPLTILLFLFGIWALTVLRPSSHDG